MKLLYITHGTWIDMESIAAGNSVRAYWLARGLAENNVKIVFAHPTQLGAVQNRNPLPNITVESYSNSKALPHLVTKCQPDAILVGYWEMLEDIPESLDLPVIVDLVAPRILEVMYSTYSTVNQEVRKMLRLYRRANHFLVGNQRQRYFLLPWLIQCGIDLRTTIPVDVVPISTEPSAALSFDPQKSHWRFVSGGVHWPWRKSEVYFDQIAATLGTLPEGRSGNLHLFSGGYIYATAHNTDIASASTPNVTNSSLLPYGAMRRYFRESADIGVELSEHNIEREFSQAFRAVESLGAGLPILINAYTALAEDVKNYDAGWCISDPTQIRDTILWITRNPAEWARKSANAVQLVKEKLDYRVTVKPLLQYLEKSVRPNNQKSHEISSQPSSTNPLRHARRTIVGRLVENLRFEPKHYQANTPATICMVTRSDFIPANHGAAVKIERTARLLSTGRSDVIVVTDQNDGFHLFRNGQHQHLQLPRWLHTLGTSRKKICQQLRRLGIPDKEAFLYQPLVDRGFLWRLLYIRLRYRITTYLAEFPAYAKPALQARNLMGGQVILVEHNIEYQRVADQFPTMSPSDQQSIKNIELELCQLVDTIVTVSAQDRNTLVAAGISGEKIKYIPHGVDLNAFDSGDVENIRSQYGIALDRPILVYHGVYSYMPNQEAIEALAQVVLPYLNSINVHPVILAIGRDPPLTAAHPDIIFTGPVTNIAPWLRAADVAVVPIRTGGGTRMKILDYFAARLPVVTTSKGIEGIPATPGRDAEVHDDLIQFSKAIVRLLNNRNLATQIGANGRAIAQQLDWTEIVKRYQSILIN